MAIGAGAAGAWNASSATTHNITLPAQSTGDMLIIVAACKTATPASLDPTVTTGTGWVRFAQFADGTTASGVGVGSVHQALFYKVATSGAETSPVITWGGSQTATPGLGVCLGFTKASTEVWLTPVAVQKATNNATSISVTQDSNPGITAGDWGIVVHTTRDDSALTVPTWTATSATLGTAVVYPTTPIASGTSNDMAGTAAYRSVTSGTASAAPVCTATQVAAETGVTGFIRLRVQTGDEAPAEVATGTGSAGNAFASIAPNAETAAGTGESLLATPAVAPNAEIVVGAGTALDATADAVSGSGALLRVYDIEVVIPAAGAVTYAPAELASGTGSAQNASVRISPNAGAGSGTGAANGGSEATTASPAVASGTGAANATSARISPNAGLASGTGAANNASVLTSARPTAATGTGAALGASARISVNAQAASGTGTAYNATVSTLVVVYAPAQVASGTGSAFGASAHVQPRPAVASGTGQAFNASGQPVTEALAQVATGTGTAYDATTAAGQYAPAETATGTGQSFGPSAAIAVNAGVATGSGAAYTAFPVSIVASFAFAETAEGTGSALGASAHVQPHAGLGSGSSHPGSDQGRVYAEISVGTGVSSTISADLVGSTITIATDDTVYADLSVDGQISSTLSVEGVTSLID